MGEFLTLFFELKLCDPVLVPYKHVIHTTRAGSWKCRTELLQKTVVDYIPIHRLKTSCFGQKNLYHVARTCFG